MRLCYLLLTAENGFLEERPARCFTGWRSKRLLRRHVAIPEHHSLKRRASQDEEAPTDERSGLACQTIWCRYAPRIAGSMAKFSAKRKGRQSFAPRFVYPPKVQIKQMRGKLLPTSRVSCHRLPSVGKCSSAAQERAYAKTGPPFSTACFILCPCRTMASLGAIRGGRFIQRSTGKQKDR